MQITTAGVIEKDGKILIAKRKKGKCLDGNWEFPGGKLESGESPEEGLKRELKEELNIETSIGEFICSSDFTCGETLIRLLAYKVQYLSGEIKIIDHQEYKWVLPDEFNKYEFVEPDIKVLNQLSKK